MNLGDWLERSDGVWELSVGDHKGADATRVQQLHELVYARVEYRLTHQGERAVSWHHRVLEPLCNQAWHSTKLAYHSNVLLHNLHYIRIAFALQLQLLAMH